MKVLIVEDEPLAADRLKAQLLSLDNTIEILGITSGVAETAVFLSSSNPELIFLDIQLSDGLCFEIFERVLPKWPVVFTTAYDQYAIEAFKLYGIAYLLKPIKKDALASSLIKYHQIRRLYQSDIDYITKDMGYHENQYKKRFLVEIGQKVKTIEVSEISYFSAQNKAVYLTLFSGQKVPIDYSLDKLENLLDPSHFFRINRKYLISIKSITSMTNYSRKRVKVVLTPPMQETLDTLVSIEKATEFRNWLDN